MSGEAPFQVKAIATRDADALSLKDLAQYQAVCLLNVAQPSPDLWQKLQRYVESGGGLAIIPPGEDLKLVDYNNEEARALLPGKFVRVISLKPGVGIEWDEHSYRPPVRNWFQEWSKTPRIGFLKVAPKVTRYWEVEPAAREDVIVRYGGEKKRPALLEARIIDEDTYVQQGRCDRPLRRGEEAPRPAGTAL